MNRRAPKPSTLTQLFYRLGSSGFGIFPVTFTLNREIVPLMNRKDPRAFRGYPTLFHALAAASATTNIGLIYQASKKSDINRDDNPSWFGHFLVFDTGMKPFSPGLGAPIGPHILPQGFLNVRYTNLEERTDTRTYIERCREIGIYRAGPDALPSGAQRTVRDYYPLVKRVVQDFAQLDSVEILADPRIENPPPSQEPRWQFLRSTVVNIHYSGRDRGYAATQDPNGDLPDFCDPSNIESPIPHLVLTSGAFEGRHPIYLLSTLAHETIHVLHVHRAAFLLERWRRSRPQRRKPFAVWALGESGRPNSGVNGFDYLMVLGLCGQLSGADLTHWEPHVEAWILKATHLPDSEINRFPLGPQSPLVEDFVRIQESLYPPSPSARELVHVRQHLQPRLVRTFKGLSEERQRIIRESLRTWLSTQGRNASTPFIQWLCRIWSINCG